MAEFVKIINSIDNLNSAVKINNFSILDKNSINISFSNNTIQGMANLIFRLNNGHPLLVDSQLSLSQEARVNTAVNDNEEVTENVNEVKDAENSFTINDADNTMVSSEQTDLAEAEKIETTVKEEVEKTSIQEEAVTEIMQEEETFDEEVEENIVENNEELDTRALNTIIENYVSRQPSIAQPLQINIIQPEQSIQNLKEEYPKEQKEATSPADLTVAEEKPEEEKIELEDKYQEEFTPDDIIENEKQEEILDTEQEANDTDITDIEHEITEPEDIAIEEDIAYTSSSSAAAEEVIDENNEIPEQTEEISDCLSDFYSTEEDTPIINEETKNNLAMNAMLSEILALREELQNLKDEAEEVEKTEKVIQTPKDFWNTNQKYVIEDEDADFKIMGDGSRINASILDDDLFIAGDKLYRWGETLYLEE